MKKFTLSLVLASFAMYSFAQTPVCTPLSTSWNGTVIITDSFTGGMQTWMVPSGITSVNVDVMGARGGGGTGYTYGSNGGKGGRVQATLAVTPGHILKIVVGGKGQDSISGVAGYNGGGADSNFTISWPGAGGGGGTYIADSTSTSYLIYAGGGGGGGGDAGSGDNGGDGGGLTGASGASAACSIGGLGGTQTSGGAGETCFAYTGSNGMFGIGGSSPSSMLGSGGGGGGYYGGGAGAEGGGGGGGSSYTDSTYATSVTHTQGYNNSDGISIITYPSINNPTYGINSLYITAGTGANLNDTGIVAGATSITGYLDRTSLTPITLYQGGVHAATLTWGNAVSYQEAQVWIDFNNDGIFQTSEEVTSVIGYNPLSTSNPLSFNIVVPNTAPLGNHLMRIRGIWELPGTTGLSTHLDPCLQQYASTGPIYNDGDAVDYMVTIAPLPLCSGAPVAGTASVFPSIGTSSTTFTLNVSGFTIGSGISFQWQSSFDSTSWSNISGATNYAYSFTGISTNTYYRCVVSCSGFSSNSNTSFATFTPPPPTCFPTSASWGYESSFYVGYGVDNFSITGYSGSILSDFGMTSSASSSTGYLDRTSITPVNLEQAGTYSSTISFLYTYAYQEAQVWIDFNNDGTFQTTEEVSPVSGYSASFTSSPTTFNINIPITAPVGLHLMRIRGVYEETFTTLGVSPAHLDPCLINYGGASPYYASGDVVDYIVNIVPLPACTGTPSAATATASTSAVCPGATFTLGLVDTAAGGIGYQWQSSLDSLTWINLTGDTTIPFLDSETVTTYYRCVQTCYASGLTNSSAGVKVIQRPYCYCIPTHTSWGYESGNVVYGIDAFSITGYSGSTLSDASMTSSASATTGYLDRTSLTPVQFQQAGNYTSSATWGYAYYYQNLQVWIDFNNDGVFQTSEEVSPVSGFSSSFTSNPTTFNINIPATADTGYHIMRIRGAYDESWTSTGVAPAHLDPCLINFGGASPTYYSGDIVDYSVYIVPLPLCTGTPYAGTATTTVSNLCPGTTFTLSLLDSPAAGLNYQWQASADSTTWSNIAGATSYPFLDSEIATTYYRCLITCSYSGITSASAGVLVNQLPYCYCLPTATSWASESYYTINYGIDQFNITGYAGSSLSDAGINYDAASTNPTTGYLDRTSLTPVILEQDAVFTANVYWGYTSSYQELQVWIDFNNDGVFQTTEEVTPVSGYSTSGTSSPTNFNITIPATADTGLHRMRIRGIWELISSSLGYAPPHLDPCVLDFGGTNPHYYSGDVVDYMVNILPHPPVIVAVPDTLSFGPITVSTTSYPLTDSVSAIFLVPDTGTLTFTAPTNFIISADGGSTWVSSFSTSYSGSILPQIGLLVEYQPTALTTDSGYIIVTGGGLTSADSIYVIGIGASACSGIPTAGVCTVTPASGNTVTPFSLSLSGTTIAGGLTYQWQSSSDSITWTNISGATLSSYSFTGIPTNTYFRCLVTCAAFGTDSSNTTLAIFIPAPICLPTTASWAYESGNIGYGVNGFDITGFSGSTLSDAGIVSAATTANPSTGYLDRTSLTPINLEQAGVYSSTVSWYYYSNHHEAQVWIDFNNDGTFQPSEEVSPVSGYSTTYSSSPTSFDITVPIDAATGLHLMRIRSIWETYYSTLGFSPLHLDPCLNHYGTSNPYYYSGDVVDYLVNIVPLPACTGAPVAGTVNAPSLICGSTGFNLTLDSSTIAAGLTYNWQSSADSITWTSIVGATTLSYYDSESIATYYRCIVSCSSSGLSDTSAGYKINYLSTCPCSPTTSSWSNETSTTVTFGVDQFMVNGFSGSTLNDAGLVSEVIASNPSTGYLSRTALLPELNLEQGGIYSSSVYWGSLTTRQEAQVWIDFNDDGTFQTSEEVTPVSGYSHTVHSNPTIFNITIPVGANPGSHYMRIRGLKELGASASAPSDLDPCLIDFAGGLPHYREGDIIDYLVNIVPLPPCTGTPVAGNVTPVGFDCGSNTFSLSLASGITASGLSYQWQASTDTLTWTNIAGATSNIYTMSETASTYYRCFITCDSTGLSATTPAMFVDYVATCPCYPTNSSWVYESSYYINFGASSFDITGFSGSNLLDSNINTTAILTNPTTGYVDRTALTPVSLEQNGVYPSAISWGNAFFYQNAQVWIDFNDDGTFDTTEEVSGVVGYSSSFTTNPTLFNINIPFTANPGLHLMRMRSDYNYYDIGVAPAHLDPCLVNFGGSYPSYYGGDVADYLVNIVPLPPCSGTPTAGSIIASSVTGCSTYTSTLTDTGSSAATGLSYQWQSSTDSITWTNITGDTTLTANVTVSSSIYYRLRITCNASGLSANTTPVHLLITPQPGPIASSIGGIAGGPFAICYTATGVTFSGAATGGTWANDAATYGSIDAVSGAWTTSGSTAGSTILTYTIGSCSAFATLNIGTTPPSIPTLATGANPLCAYDTLTVTDDITGGVWTSSDTTKAVVNSTTGFVTGTGHGTVLISYNDGCGTSTLPLTINGSAISISPASGNICDGASVTLVATLLSDTGSGYSWTGPYDASTSSSLTIASMDSTKTGIYIFSVTTSPATGSCTETVSKFLIDMPTPNITVTPSGILNSCLGVTDTLAISANVNPTYVPILSQNFNSSLADQISGMWTIVNPGGANAYNWAITAPSAWYDVTITGDGTNFMGANGDLSGGPIDTRLISPSFSTVGYSSVNLSFNHFINSWFLDNQAEIDYSIDGGATWSLLNTSTNYLGYYDGYTSWTAGTPTHIIALPTAAIGQPNVMLRWWYAPYYGYQWAVDNIVVSGSPIETYTYAWSGIGGASGIACSTCSTTSITPTATGNNVYHIIANAGSCSSSVNDTIYINTPIVIVTDSAAPNPVCNGSNVNLNAFATSATDSIASYSWAGPGFTYTSATNPNTSFTVDTSNAGVYTFSATSISGCTVSASSTHVIVSLPPSAILGIPSLCVGATTSLADSSIISGTWTSNNTSVATVNTSTGVVTGVAIGSATISFSTTCGLATKIITVNSATPSAISGSANLCLSSGLTNYTDIVPGGSWSISPSGIATITSAGLLNELAPGIAIITYTTGCGTPATKALTIQGPPSAITGANLVCVGSITTFADASSGGEWSSGNPIVATISGTTGILSVIDTGTTIITYSQTCGSAYDTIKVINLPNPILGTATLCPGSTTTLSDSTVSGTWTSTNDTIATISSSGVVSATNSGTTTIRYTNVCGAAIQIVTVNNITAPITGLLSVCAGGTTSLYDAVGGGSWMSSDTTKATINNFGIATGMAIGTVTISYHASCGTVTATLNINSASPSAIGGSNIVCQGDTITLTDGVPGGSWSSTSSIAIVTTSGKVIGENGGVTTISYSTGCGTAVAKTVTVTAIPSAISGLSTACIGSSTSLADSVTGGTWSSSNITKATIDASTGIVYGIATGTTNISYNNGCGIGVTKTITVLASPSSITGVSSVCKYATVTFSDATLGGTWTSSDTSKATVNSINGIVTGNGGGTVSISYGNVCNTVSKTLSVLNAPVSISGIPFICSGSSTTLSDAASGGIWTTLDTTKISIANDTVGIIHGITNGTAVVTYQTIANGLTCGTQTLSLTINNASPMPIIGMDSVCPGGSIALADSTPYGVWSSSNPGIANVSSTGVVTGLGAGIVTITYSTSCGTASTKLFTVNAIPSVIIGNSTICSESHVTFSDSTSGGTWSSSIPSVATVASSSGIVTGNSAGTTTISYSILGCTSTQNITVNPIPYAGNIFGLDTVYENCSISLVDSTASLDTASNWSVSNPIFISVSGSGITGIVNGLHTGMDTIIFNSFNGCGISHAYFPIYIKPFNAGSIAGMDSICLGATTTLYDSTAMNGTPSWSSSDTTIATVSNGVVSGVALGTATITYSRSLACNTVITTTTVNVHSTPTVNPITGPSTVCQLSHITLMDTLSGGTWFSATVSASINPITGIMYGITAGIDTISYSITNTCGTGYAKKGITILSLASAGIITPIMDTLCFNGTDSAYSSVPGGTWSSMNTSIATVNSTSGKIYGVAVGADSIKYIVTNTCNSDSSYRTVYVKGLPSVAPISGINNVCQGSNITLIDSTNGGEWISGVDSLANINSLGVLMGTHPGIDTISYMVTNSCGSSIATYPILIKALPNAGFVYGYDTICIGTSYTFTDSVNTGLWSISNGNATLAGDTVTGVTTGYDTLYYTVTNTCGFDIDTVRVYVNPLANAGIISGTDSVCKNSNLTLSETVSGGSWSITTPSIATINAALGILNGINAGLDTAIYSITNYCNTAKAIYPVYVDTSFNIQLSTGISYVCIGSRRIYDSLNLNTGIPTNGAWSVTNITIATISNNGIVQGLAPGKDTVKYTLSNVCGLSTGSAVIIVHTSHECDSISNVGTVANNDELIKVYPNPSEGNFTVELPDASQASSILVLDMYGKVIESREFKDASASKVTFDLGNIASGTYMIKVNMDGKNYVGKILIMGR